MKVTMKSNIAFVIALLLCNGDIFIISKSIPGPENSENELRCKRKEDFLTNTNCVKNTLKHMGYFQPSEDLNDYQQAIRDFQTFYKLKVTGDMTDEMAALLSRDGCGVPDVLPDPKSMKRLKRQIMFIMRRKSNQEQSGQSGESGTKSYWSTTTIPWCISAYSNDLTIRQQDEAIIWSLQKWSEQSQLVFPRRSNCRSRDVIIEIKWTTGAHNDFSDFDGEGGTLAHAILPIFSFTRLAGDVHFDDDETWSVASYPERNRKLIKSIAAHELGHSLGFPHHPSPGSIMYRFDTNDPEPSLSQDDIDLLQSVYGAPPQPEEEIAPKDVCRDIPDIRAAAMLGDGVTYAFNGPHYWRVDKHGLIDHQTLLIRDNWFDERGFGLAGNFDAVLFVPVQHCTPTCIGNTYFIKGNKVWEINLSDGTSGRTTRRYIDEVFPQAPIHIDGAFLWRFGIDSTLNLQIYMIKGHQYYRSGSSGPPYAMISVGGLSSLWNQGWREGDHQAALLSWDYDGDDGSVTMRNCFFQHSFYVCHTGASDQPDEGFPKTVKYWYGCDGFRDDEETNPDHDNGETDTSDNDEDGREPPMNHGTSHFCAYGSRIDAITVMGDGLTYAFSGTYYWRMNSEGQAIDENPRTVNSNWFGNGFVGNFDAVVFRPSEQCNPTCRGTTYFFQDNKVYVQENSDGSGGNVAMYYNGVMPRLPDNIDVATLVQSDRCSMCGNLFFSKGSSHYITAALHTISPWRPYDLHTEQTVPWQNIEWTSIDAVLYPWNEDDSFRFYYVFNGNEYLKYDTEMGRVADGYPRALSSC